MKIEDLPGTPRIWLDFLRSQLSSLPAPITIETVIARAAELQTGFKNTDLIRSATGGTPEFSKARENAKRLVQPGSVAVVTDVYAGLFGGPVVQILKCLTTVRICEQLQQAGVNAIPVCWVTAQPPRGCSDARVTVTDRNGEIRSLMLSPGEPSSKDQISTLYSNLQEMGGGQFDPDVLAIVWDAFVPARDFSSGIAALLSALMHDLGLVVINPLADASRSFIDQAVYGIKAKGSSVAVALHAGDAKLLEKGYSDPFPQMDIPLPLIQSALMPVLACVVDRHTVYSAAKSAQAFQQMGFVQPAVWPAVSATLGDARSRRILRRYDLDLAQLYSGKTEVLRRIADSLPRSALQKLRHLESKAESRLAEIRLLDSSDRRLSEAVDSCREKIVYQIRKLADNCDAALSQKEQVADRQISRLCNILAPKGNLQEWELAGIQIPLDYSRDGLRRLYEKIDILNFEHQLLWMD